MIATKQMDLRANIKKYFDLAFNGETIVVSRKENKNVVVISEQEYNELQRAKRNAEYLAKLDRSFAQLKQGEVVIKSMEELERMADEWFHFYKGSIWGLTWLADSGQENNEKN